MLFGIDLPTEPTAIERLCTIRARHKQNFELRRFPPGKTFFHPKLSISQSPLGRLGRRLQSLVPQT